jgi:hypothetical protein
MVCLRRRTGWRAAARTATLYAFDSSMAKTCPFLDHKDTLAAMLRATEAGILDVHIAEDGRSPSSALVSLGREGIVFKQVEGTINPGDKVWSAAGAADAKRELETGIGEACDALA